jgi:hypothetical protein
VTRNPNGEDAMNCPVCSAPLVAVDRQGIEIDHCPRCRGVWLDRGELDKLLERSMYPENRGYDRDDDDDDDDDRRRRGHYGHSGHGYPPHAPPKKKGFWGRVFDFD